MKALHGQCILLFSTQPGEMNSILSPLSIANDETGT